MGNSHCEVINNTTKDAIIQSYNYADCFQWIPFKTYKLEPTETATVEAAPDMRGLKICLVREGVRSKVFLASNKAVVSVTALENLLPQRDEQSQKEQSKIDESREEDGDAVVMPTPCSFLLENDENEKVAEDTLPETEKEEVKERETEGAKVIVTVITAGEDTPSAAEAETETETEEKKEAQEEDMNVGNENREDVPSAAAEAETETEEKKDAQEEDTNVGNEN